MKDDALIIKTVLSSCLTRIASPGFIPEHIAIIGSYVAISLIFFLDLITGPEITFHILYIFPLTFIALHSSQHWTEVSGDILSIADKALYRAKSSGKGCVVREYAVPREITDIREKEMQ